MCELTVNMMISLDGFAGGSDDDDGQAEFGAGFGPELAAYIQQVLDEPQSQVMLMGRETRRWPATGLDQVANRPKP